jgi:hypothetical protein
MVSSLHEEVVAYPAVSVGEDDRIADCWIRPAEQRCRSIMRPECWISVHCSRAIEDLDDCGVVWEQENEREVWPGGRGSTRGADVRLDP